MVTTQIEARFKMSSNEPQFIVNKVFSVDTLQCNDRKKDRLLVGQSV